MSGEETTFLSCGIWSKIWCKRKTRIVQNQVVDDVSSWICLVPDVAIDWCWPKVECVYLMLSLLQKQSTRLQWIKDKWNYWPLFSFILQINLLIVQHCTNLSFIFFCVKLMFMFCLCTFLCSTFLCFEFNAFLVFWKIYCPLKEPVVLHFLNSPISFVSQMSVIKIGVSLLATFFVLKYLEKKNFKNIIHQNKTWNWLESTLANN